MNIIKNATLPSVFAGMLALASSSAGAAISADYTLAPGSTGDEDSVSLFNIYDFATGATLIVANPGNLGNLGTMTFVVGDEFTGYFQSHLIGHQLDGVNVLNPALNTQGASGSGSGYEITTMATFTERVIEVGIFGPTFQILSGTAQIMLDTTPDYVSTGVTSGYDNGATLLTGSIVGGGGSVILPFLAGFSQIDVAITGGDLNVFSQNIISANGVFTLDLRSSATAGITHVQGIAYVPGTNLLLGADGNLELQAVPIPSAVWLLASALAGLGIIRRREES